MTRAVLEIGDSAVRLVVASGAAPDDAVLRDTRTLRLRAAVQRDGRISEGFAELLVETVRRLRDAAGRVGAPAPEVIVVGGAARQAIADGLRRRIGLTTGAPVRVLDPDDERRLLFAAATSGGTAAIVEFDAGRLEVGVGVDRELAWAASLQVGPTSPAGAAGPRAARLLPDRLEEELTPLARMSPIPVTVVRRDTTRPATTGQDAAILTEICRVAGVTDAEVTDRSVADGILLMTDQPEDAVPHGSAWHAARLLTADAVHARQVARLAVRLFDGTAGLHGYRDRARQVLRGAAELHDVGSGVASGGDHRLGARIVERAVLAGFAPHERAAIACLVRFHKGAGPSPGYTPFTGLHPSWRDRVTALTALLRVADGLDRGHDAAVCHLDTEIDDAVVRLTIRGDRRLDFARWGATAAAPMFERRFGRRLEVAAADTTSRVTPLPPLALPGVTL